MGAGANTVEFLASHMLPAKDPVGRLMARGDELLVDIHKSSPGQDDLLRGHLYGIIEAVHLITFAKTDDVKAALRLRWDRAHS